MKRLLGPLLLILLLALGGLGRGAAIPAHAAVGAALVGRVIDFQGQPVRRASVALYINGESTPRVNGETQRDGTFVLDLPDEPVDKARLEIRHPHFRTAVWEAAWADLGRLNDGSAIRLPDILLERRLTAGFWIATAVFLGVLILIATERLHSTMAALLGAALILGISLVGRPINEGLFILDFEQAIEYVDFNVVFLVMGMMIVIGVIEETGIFQWTAFQAYRLSRGRVWLLAIFLMLLTSVASAFLDNVTTMLLIAPITLEIALTLGIDPLSLLIPEVLASNVGGTSTLIGTPTNILIGSYAHITFNDFLRNLTPGVLLAQVALIVYILLLYHREYRSVSKAFSPTLLARLEENARITQPDKLRKAGGVFLAIILLFVLGERFHLEPAVTAILGAVAILLVVRADIEEMLRVVDWTTLMFFIALFIVIGAVQEVGLIGYIAVGIRAMVGENLTAAMLVIIWAGAILSGVIDSIPFTAAMLPVVGFLSRSLPGTESKVLFYSLAIGSALGGNISLIGSATNIVAAGIAERAGYSITFRKFLRVGLPATAITVAVGTVWLFIRF